MIPVTYLAYLDEFGHIGPYVSRGDPRYHDSPIFGLAGFVMPIAQIREFAMWVFRLKKQVFSHELVRSNKIPAQWEKKGSSLYTVKNVTRYRQTRLLTNRLLEKVTTLGGFVFYVGTKKTAGVDSHNPNSLYTATFLEAIKRIDQFCTDDCGPGTGFMVVLDEHSRRSAIVTAAGQSMFGGTEPRRRLIEPPFQVESHRYQTVQAADWIAGLVGRIGAYRADPVAYPENEVFLKYFGQRVQDHSRRSGIRGASPLAQ